METQLSANIVAWLDPGIRSTVEMLWRHGFRTTDSGDGVSKPEAGRVFDMPHVACVCPVSLLKSEADRLHITLGKDWRVEASYCPNENSDTAILFAMYAEPR
jgi:hypothetical protein